MIEKCVHFRDYISNRMDVVPIEVVDEQNGKITEQRTTTISKTKGSAIQGEKDCSIIA